MARIAVTALDARNDKAARGPLLHKTGFAKTHALWFGFNGPL